MKKDVALGIDIGGTNTALVLSTEKGTTLQKGTSRQLNMKISTII